mmetsp:Transcript_40030/g.95998  ORF Transcript_40030/g.95998 Transcript_40030/m.95998 type:complete len:417 (+) Transcript_40030:88-1338(+)
MILYDTREVVGTLFHWEGTVLPEVIPYVLGVGVISALIFLTQIEFQWKLDIEGIHILGTIVGFLLIFRSSNAFATYCQSNRIITSSSCVCADILTIGVCYCRGPRPEDGPEIHAKLRDAKTGIARLVLAFCVLFKLHTRVAYEGYMRGKVDGECKQQIDFDVIRLRGLLRKRDFDRIQEVLGFDWNLDPVVSCDGEELWSITQDPLPRPTTFIISALRAEFLGLCGKPYGYMERVLNLADSRIAELQRIYTEMSSHVSVPLPLPYCHLCRTLMLMFLLVYATHIDPTLGSIANIIIPMVIALAMFGIDAISSEIEDPFGDDPNDFELMPVIHRIEMETLLILSAGQSPDISHDFVWVSAPEEYAFVDRFLVHQSNLGFFQDQLGLQLAEAEDDGFCVSPLPHAASSGGYLSMGQVP